MTAHDPVVIALQVVTLVAILLALLFKSYFTEKGKNLATKEDIQNITALVESVKVQLHYSLQARLSLRAEEQQALVDYYSHYAAWVSGITNSSFVGLSDDTGSHMQNIRSRLDTLHETFDLAAGKMSLFVSNADILSRHATLMLETLKLSHFVQTATFTFDKAQLRIEQLKATTRPVDQVAAIQPVHEEMIEQFRAFKNDLVQRYGALKPHIDGQRRAISAHLRSLAEN